MSSVVCPSRYKEVDHDEKEIFKAGLLDDCDCFVEVEHILISENLYSVLNTDNDVCMHSNIPLPPLHLSFVQRNC